MSRRTLARVRALDVVLRMIHNDVISMCILHDCTASAHAGVTHKAELDRRRGTYGIPALEAPIHEDDASALQRLNRNATTIVVRQLDISHGASRSRAVSGTRRV